MAKRFIMSAAKAAAHKKKTASRAKAKMRLLKQKMSLREAQAKGPEALKKYRQSRPKMGTVAEERKRRLKLLKETQGGGRTSLKARAAKQRVRHGIVKHRGRSQP